MSGRNYPTSPAERHRHAMQRQMDASYRRAARKRGDFIPADDPAAIQRWWQEREELGVVGLGTAVKGALSRLRIVDNPTPPTTEELAIAREEDWR